MTEAALAVIDKTEKKKIGLNFRFHATAATIRYILIILKGKARNNGFNSF